MNKPIWVLLIGGFFILGCSHTHTYVLNKKSKTSFVSQLNTKGSGNKGQIITKNRKRVETENIRVGNDSVFGEFYNSSKSYAIGFNDVKRILISKPRSRANDGFYGFIAGFTVGGVIGLLSGDDGSQGIGPGGPGAGQKAVILGFLFGSLGAVIGGSGPNVEENIFIFDETTTQPKHYLLKDVLILDETETSIQIKWQESTVWLVKDKIKIIKKDNGIDIRVPDEIYREKFRRWF
jgi:hypothetical protein